MFCEDLELMKEIYVYFLELKFDLVVVKKGNLKFEFIKDFMDDFF